MDKKAIVDAFMALSLEDAHDAYHEMLQRFPAGYGLPGINDVFDDPNDGRTFDLFFRPEAAGLPTERRSLSFMRCEIDHIATGGSMSPDSAQWV